MYLKYDPFYSLAKLWEPGAGPDLTEPYLTSPADMDDRAEDWVFRVDVPGVEKDHINIHVDGDQLVVSGDRHEKTEERKEGYTYIERVDGNFERRFVLPETADRGEISAKTKNGVLEIHVGKQSEVKPRRISVEEH